jgi:hypothetical protein
VVLKVFKKKSFLIVILLLVSTQIMGMNDGFTQSKSIRLKLCNGFKLSFLNDPVTPLTFGCFYLFERDVFRDMTLEAKILSFTVGSVWIGSIFKNAFFNDAFKKSNKMVKAFEIVIDHPSAMVPAAMAILPRLGQVSTVVILDDDPRCPGLA